MSVHGRRAITLTETIVLLVILAIGCAYIVVQRRRVPCCGGTSKRLVCTANLKGIGTSCKIYANDNDEAWPVPAFDESSVGSIDYTVRVGGGEGSVRSPSRTQASVGGRGGTRQLSVTRSTWMLVRSGNFVPQQLICPSSGDTPDPSETIDTYYDFADNSHISYGFQVPFGPPATRPHNERDNRMILAADKGPYRSADVAIPPQDIGLLTPPTRAWIIRDPKQWHPFNSPNHPDGQNVLFADGHAEFRRTPTVGVDHDNIYTVALSGDDRRARVIGESPWVRSAPPLMQRDATGRPTCRDSVIFP